MIQLIQPATRRPSGPHPVAHVAAHPVAALAAAALAMLACGGPHPQDAAHTAPAAAPAPATSAAAAAAADDDEGYANTARDALIGHRAPAAAITMLNGDRVMLGDLIGHKPIYLKFWATWCKPCREQMPHLEAAYHTHGDQIAMFAVDVGLNDPVETVRAFQAEHALTVPIALDTDGSLGEAFHVAVTPQHILIDRTGIVRYIGHAATPELDHALDRLLRDAGAPDAPAVAAAATDEPLALHLVDGSTFTLAAQRGRPVALTFVTAWCDTYLETSRPAMAKACAAHTRQVEALRRSRADIAWVTVAHPVWTARSDLEDYNKRLGASAPIGIDSRAAWFHRFGVRDVPTTIVLDGRGVEIARVHGPGDDLARALPPVMAR